MRGLVGKSGAVRAIRDALTTLFPIGCGGCGQADSRLCVTCLTALRAAVAPAVEQLPQALAVVTAMTYVSPLAELFDAYKERGRADLAKELGALLRVSLRHATTELGLAKRSSEPRQPLLLIPAPSRRAARARRGYDHVPLLIERALPRARPVSALRHTRRVADQSALGRGQRAHNLVGAMVASPLVRDRSCVVVDDLVTTGATLGEAARALRDAGATVLGAVAIARVERLYHSE